MGNFWETLDEINKTLDNVSDTLDTTKHGINKVKESKEEYDYVVNRILSGENDRDMELAVKYYNKKQLCIRRTIIFCVLIIFATVLVCVFW